MIRNEIINMRKRGQKIMTIYGTEYRIQKKLGTNASR